MILRANKTKSKSQTANVEFIKADATKLNQVISRHFDCMTIALCLHEMSPQTRRDIIANCLLSSDTIIITDFSSPFPRGKAGTFLRMQEAFAGRRHFHNFKNWIGAGGIDGFMKGMGLTAHKLVQWENGAGKVAIIKVADAKGRTEEMVQEP